jgi:hypothetical protein
VMLICTQRRRARNSDGSGIQTMTNATTWQPRMLAVNSKLQAKAVAG